MAHWLENENIRPDGKKQASYGMDSMADAANLPNLADGLLPGSDAFAALEKKLVILQSTGTWV